MASRRLIGFEMSISARDDGTLEAVYILVRDRKVAKTVEILPDILMADYDRRGELVGIEILAPVKLSRLTSLVEKPKRRSFRRFVQETAPGELIQA